ncbi:MAG: Ribose-phosphate pyrophosphokinase subfamily [Thermoplasmatales archaeon I-plasma]|nr:MAG: Ribose-phosphate pyrophosphokinase subfamily [Thermoplasmatales archaeon I-plasma]
MKIVSTSNSEGLSSKISSILDVPLARISRRRFADGELYVRLEEPLDEAILVGSTYPDSGIIDILLTADASLNAGVKKPILLIPYFGYARQDAMFQPYEAVSARVLSNLFKERFEKILVINMHSPEGMAFLGKKGEEIRAEPVIGKKVKEDGNDLVISPDDGFKEEGENISKVAGLDSIYLNKKRVSDTKVEITIPEGISVRDKVVALTDDMISTGGTILESSKVLKQNGAKAINVYCVHGLFVSGTSKYAGFVDSISTTDTVEGPFSKMTVSEIAASSLRKYI